MNSADIAAKYQKTYFMPPEVTYDWVKKDSITRGIEVSIEDNEICLGFHVIVAYGVNIPVVSQNLMDSVRYQVEEFTGMKIDRIDIFVEGVRVID